MNDYLFGNKLYSMRKAAGLTQAQVARLVGVSDKTVSKWENGNAKPAAEVLQKLEALFKVSAGELLKLRDRSDGPMITKIVITGGPCAGKTTGLSWIQNTFSQLGYVVLVVPETATELISGGVTPLSCGTNLDYQKCQMRLQLEKESLFEQAAGTMKTEKVLIVCDRGAMDNRAYMDDLEFSQVLDSIGRSEVHLRDSYDAVFHLETAAKGAVEFYTTDNNKARTETPEEAAALDDKLIAAWTGHPHLRVIDNSTNFEEKLKRLIAEMQHFLGEPEPYEIERRFLIRYPDVKKLEALPNCRKVEIIQTYLKAKDGDELRIRQRGENGNYIYYKTLKHTVTPLKRVEIEENLTQDEYLQLLMEADPALHQIRKTRYCLTYENQYFKIDIYPFWNDRALMEIELRDEKETVRFPGQLEIIKEVTDDGNYNSRSLAQNGGHIPEA